MTGYTPNFRLQLPAFNAEGWDTGINDNLIVIDALLAKYLSLSQLQGPWQNGTIYTVGQTTVDITDATLWTLTVGYTSATAPTTFAADRAAHPTYWVSTTNAESFRGPWLTATAYRRGDFVVTDNIYAVCITPHTSSALFTTDAADWSYLINLRQPLIDATAAKNAAASSAGNALTSENNASSSASTASGHASTATTQAGLASGSASTAGGFASAASGSASAASGSASAAGGSASTASANAHAASTQASIATTEATAANNSALASAGSAAAAATTASSILSVAQARNRIINGAFTVNQRTYVSGTSVIPHAFCHDRWKANTSGAAYTFTQNNHRTVVTITAGTIYQGIEGSNLPEGGTYILAWDGTAKGRFGAGGFSSSPLVVTGLAAGVVAYPEFSLGTLTNVRMYPGNIDWGFLPRGAGEELALCLRYFYKSLIGIYLAAYGGSTNFPCIIETTFPVPMRIPPTTTALFDNYANANGGLTYNVSIYGMQIGITSINTGGFSAYYSVGNTADAEL